MTNVTIHTVDVSDYADWERPDMTRPYEVISSPYGETVARYFATEAEARAEVAAIAAMRGTYMTSWGEYPVDTTAQIIHYVDAAPACAHWECALMGDTCSESGAPVMMPPRAPRTYRARRIASRFYEYTYDGITPSDDIDAFNVDAAPYWTDDEALTFDSVADLVAAIRRDYVRFDAYGDGMTAGDPDGSQIIDYATGAREAVSWHLDGIAPALLSRVIIPAVDAR